MTGTKDVFIMFLFSCCFYWIHCCPNTSQCFALTHASLSTASLHFITYHDGCMGFSLHYQLQLFGSSQRTPGSCQELSPLCRNLERILPTMSYFCDLLVFEQVLSNQGWAFKDWGNLFISFSFRSFDFYVQGQIIEHHFAQDNPE